MRKEIKWEIEELIEEYEWLVSYKEEGDELTYVVSIKYDDINREGLYTDYIHIENIDWIYSVSGGDYAGVERAYELFERIEKDVILSII